MPRKLLRTAATLVFPLITNLSFAQHHHSNSSSQLDQYVEHVSELSSRARANVYFANPQSIFRGVQVNFVNVGAGNLTFLRRDLVASGRIPLVFARVYDSSGKGSVDFGPGWTLSAAESITTTDGKAHLFTENGSTIDFVKADKTSFALEKDYPSDYIDLRLVDSTTLQAKLRTGTTKQFQLIGDAFRLVKVTDSNGNEVRLSYSNGLLNKIENANHSIAILRNAKGRILSAQDDQNRKVQFVSDAQGRLIEVDDLGGNAWTYSYNADGKLKAAKDPLQRLNFSVFFHDDGRVRRLQLPSGTIQFNYDNVAHSTTVLDRKSLVSRFFQNEDGITTRVVNPLGEETAIALDNSRNVLSLSRNGSVLERMEYDQQHRLTLRHTIQDTGTLDRDYSYDLATGQLAGIHFSKGQDQSFTYDENGNLASVALPEGEQKFRFSSNGDLAGLSTSTANLTFSPDPDGLFASMTAGQNAQTALLYKAGSQLREVTFPGGSKGAFAYQPSGLRTKLMLNDGSRAEYNYDPAGNLTASKVFDKKGKQINGQKLEMDESYQLTRWTLFDGTVTDFKYDRNGNLTEIKKGKSITRFEYDAVNRLNAVITPAGQRLTYSYKPGERSLIEQHQHAAVLVEDLRDTGLTFASQLQVTATRPVTGLIGSARFSETLGTFLLSGSDGTEVVRPQERLQSALKKLFLYDSSASAKELRSGFNIPFNTMFMPAEYVTINCCPECYDDSGEWYCPPCFTPPPPIGTMSCDNTSIVRGQQLSCTGAGDAGSTFSWKFVSGQQTVQPAGAGPGATWTGIIVTNGTVFLDITFSDSSVQSFQSAITVTPRTNFAFTAVSPAEVANSTYTCPASGIMSVPSPPIPNQEIGLSCINQQLFINPSSISDGGPNNGYWYVLNASNSSQANGVNPTQFVYVISPDLENSASTFSIAQCGNYNAQTNPNGFISRANLLTNTVRHESGTVQSHYINYKASQDATANNVGTAVESVIAIPGTASSSFTSSVFSVATSHAQVITSATQVEPCGTSSVNFDASCTFNGPINFAPYVSCQ
jgi:YD repeat-containing protein